MNEVTELSEIGISKLRVIIDECEVSYISLEGEGRNELFLSNQNSVEWISSNTVRLVLSLNRNNDKFFTFLVVCPVVINNDGEHEVTILG